MAQQNGRQQEFAVIGLGRFGLSLATTLVERGYYVLGIDRERDIIQHAADVITQVVALDATDENALRAVDIGSFDTVIVAIGENFECNIMATVASKSLGVRRVVCKARTERQRDILLRVGADHVVLPEHEAGQRLAYVLTGPNFLDQIELEPGISITEIRVPKTMIGETLLESDLRRRYGVTLLVVKRGKTLVVLPATDYVFQEDDLLVVIGTNEDIGRLSETN